jgi:Pectinacetylesterase
VTDAACTTRWAEQHNLMTTFGLPMREANDGLLSDSDGVNPAFARFNHVRIHYCSSDGYSGDAVRTIGGRKTEFRGHRIVDAVIEDLMEGSVVGSPTLRDATEVIFAGSSAGAFGVHNNVDRIAARLSWAKVKAVADSGWIPDIPPYGPGTLDVRPDTPNGVEYYHAQPDESCAAANSGQAGKCLLESFVFRYLSTPTFVYADQRDQVHLGTLGIDGRGSRSPDQQAYVQRYMQLVRESLADVPAAFSPAIGGHTSLANDRYQSVTIEGRTLAQTLATWYTGGTGPVKLIAPPGADRGGPAQGDRPAQRGRRGR